jgi:hypothetical protein
VPCSRLVCASHGIHVLINPTVLGYSVVRMKTLPIIQVLVGRSRREVNEKGADDVRTCDTIREAKSYVKYAFTVDYQRSNEFSEPMNYARIIICQPNGVRDDFHSEYFRPGYDETRAELVAALHRARLALIGFVNPSDCVRKAIAHAEEALFQAGEWKDSMERNSGEEAR